MMMVLLEVSKTHNVMALRAKKAQVETICLNVIFFIIHFTLLYMLKE